MALKWTRVMPGEYKCERDNGWWYYIDIFGDFCSMCDHKHEGWMLSGAPAWVTRQLGLYPTLREAKVAAEKHSKEVDSGGC